MNEIEEIKARLPIEQVVGSYVPLKKSGRIYKANCPFHGEKTPSFTVSPERGIFKCFGCGEGGDIFDFLMKIEGVTFPEATRLLAEKAGVTLPEWKPEKNSSGVLQQPKDRLLQVNRYVSRLWHTILTQHEKAGVARDYLQGRGLTAESITQFEIGYAPFGPTTGLSLQKAGFTTDEVQQAGDPTKFQDRIVFPISDITGRTIAFTGRLLEVKDDPKNQTSRGPKYWNTPETALFHKSRAVFALYQAKRAIQEQNVAILAEGQMDVVMLHQAGFTHAVASSGTALTIDQLNLIARFSQIIAFAYDQDAAGIEATKKGIALALSLELTPLVIVLPKGKDPAECLQKEPAIWQKAYDERMPFMQWLISDTLPESSLLSPEQKKQAARILVPWLAKITDPIERADWLRIVAARLQTEEVHLITLLKRLAAPTKSSSEPSESTESVDPIEPPQDPHTHLAELIFALLVLYPTLIPQVKDQLINLPLKEGSPLVEILLPHFTLVDETHQFDLKKALPEQEKQTEVELLINSLTHSYQEQEIEPQIVLADIYSMLQRIRSEGKEAQKTRLASAIQNAQLTGNTEEVKRLFNELKNLL